MWKRTSITILVLTMLTCCQDVLALTGSGESLVGMLETVAPQFSDLLVTPNQATRGDTVTITFTTSEPLLNNADVTVNWNPADYVSEVSGSYTYKYVVQAADPGGMAIVGVAGRDLVGNPGTLNNWGVLEIGQSITHGTPLYGWPLILVFLWIGVRTFGTHKAKRRAVRLLLVGTLSGFACSATFAQSPTVSNVSFNQRPDAVGGTEVIITYDLDSPSAPCDITVTLSKNGGTDGFPYSMTSVTGDLSGVTTGTDRQIVWNIVADYPNENIPQAQIRLTADNDPGSVTPGEMVSVPTGSFEMGDPWGEGYDWELPVHTVTLSAYEIGKYEVTNAEYANGLNWALNTGRLTDTSGDISVYGQVILDVTSSYCQISYSGSEFVVPSRDSLSMTDHPVVEVSWYGAAVYCNWLSEANGLQPCYDTSTWECDLSKNGYHLPTEAQWERAAAWDPSGDGPPDGPGRHYRYGNGSDSSSCATANAFGGAYCNPLGLSGWPYTSPVGYYTGVTSPVGCYDMNGNVGEWCSDWYDSTYYSSSSDTDPEGPASTGARLWRDGSWNHDRIACRTAYRRPFDPRGAHSEVGFRIAK